MDREVRKGGYIGIRERRKGRKKREEERKGRAGKEERRQRKGEKRGEKKEIKKDSQRVLTGEGEVAIINKLSHERQGTLKTI